MTKHVHEGIYHEKQAVGTEDATQPALSQLARIPLPDNFASRHQIDTFLNYLNGKTVPNVKDDFKELGRGQFGVVYQVRLPDVGLVAAKILPETIRRTKHQRDKRKQSDDSEESQEMISKHEIRKKQAVEMLIDEIKVMHKAGKHVNIVALKKVAYPEAKFKLLFTGGPIADEDSFYLMELCSNGSLESMLKRFIQPSSNQFNGKLSLYETLSNRPDLEMTVTEAYEQCLLTDDDLKLIAYQVACGLDYLNRRQIAHCDIAPRNVLVTSRFIMKICDFGYRKFDLERIFE
jgi:serine/threonine protein kinase